MYFEFCTLLHCVLRLMERFIKLRVNINNNCIDDNYKQGSLNEQILTDSLHQHGLNFSHVILRKCVKTLFLPSQTCFQTLNTAD